MVVCVALLHARRGANVLIDAPDNDTLMAGLCGLSTALEPPDPAVVRPDLAEIAAVHRIHLQTTAWWVSKTTGDHRPLKNTASATERADRVKSEVLAIGKIAHAVCWMADTKMNYLPVGKQRALTVAYGTGLFGGDTVERVHGFTPASGLHALLFAQSAVGATLPATDFATALEPAVTTCRSAEQLVKAAMYLKHRTWFSPPSEAQAAEWLAGQSMDAVGFEVFSHDRTAKNQLPSASTLPFGPPICVRSVSRWSSLLQ